MRGWSVKISIPKTLGTCPHDGLRIRFPDWPTHKYGCCRFRCAPAVRTGDLDIWQSHSSLRSARSSAHARDRRCYHLHGAAFVVGFGNPSDVATASRAPYFHWPRSVPSAFRCVVNRQ